MLIFLVTNLVVLPVAIAFFFNDMGSHWMIFNISCDTLFILDIAVNFRTGECHYATTILSRDWGYVSIQSDVRYSGRAVLTVLIM